MNKLLVLLSIFIIVIVTGCASTCMEYRSATTAARSEKDLIRAEEWGLKALESPECNPNSDAHVPYFLAIEIYLQQKNYTKMAKMLDIAENRNPDQSLERPFLSGDIPILTIGEGIEAYRDQEWVKIYNKAVDLIQKDKIEEGKKEIEIAILINPKKGENYSTLAAIYLQNGNIDIALATVNRGLETDDSNSMLYQLKADISSQNNDLIMAEESYLKAIEFSENPEPIMKKLLFVYIDMGDNQKAINYSNYLLDTINRGLETDDTNSMLYQLKADISSQNNDLRMAEESYLKAIEFSDNPGPIMKKLLFVYIDMGDNQKAIDYSNELLDKYPNDADLYYNIGVLFQRLTLELFDPTRELFLKTTYESPSETIRKVYVSFKTVRQYSYNSKDFFMQASDLELDENLSTRNAVSEMSKLMDQIDELFIPSIRETAQTAGFELE